MSASSAGKFQDHYTILGVDPKANSEAIQAAYAKQAKKYHKDTPETGDQKKFESVNLAFEVLSDATLRAEFDKIKGIDQDDGKPMFTGLPFFESLARQNGVRSAVLSVLYDRREQKPYRPSLSMRHLDILMAVTNDELNFALWYLKQRGLVEGDDKSNLQITVSGMDFLEHLRPDPESVLRFLKPSAVTSTVAATPALPILAAALQETSPQEMSAPMPAPKPIEETESVSKFLNRALARRS